MADTERLLWGLKNGDIETVKQIISGGKIKVSEELSGGRMPIHFAADYGQPEVIEYLISQGANVDSPDKHGITPLCAAIFENHLDCIRVLLKNGANKGGHAPSGEPYIDVAESDDAKDLLR